MRLDTDSRTMEVAARVDAAVKGHRRPLLEFIKRRIRNGSDAEDVLQDVFYQLAASYSVLEPIENLTAWLFTVARNRITDRYRKRRNVTWPQEREEAGQNGPMSLEEVLFDPEDGPDRAYFRSMVWTELGAALDDLPDEQRDVFVWHELEGRSFREIAEWTGVPVNTLLSRKRYAVLALRERLQELYDELENP